MHVGAWRIGVVTMLGLVLAVLGWQASTRSVDFPIYHAVGAGVLAGDYALYPDALFAPGPARGADAGHVDPHGFRYAPAVAFLFAPFGLLPLEVAAFLFFLLKIAAFVAIVRVLARWADAQVPLRHVLPLTALVTAGYLAEDARNGNAHLFVVLLMVVAFDGAARGRIAVPAVALAVAIAAKLLPVVLLGYFAVRRRFAVVAATGAVLALLWMLPAAFVGMETNLRLFQAFVRYTAQKVDEQGNHSLKGALFRHLTPHRPDDARYDTTLAVLPETLVSGLWILGSAVGAFVLVAAIRRDPRSGQEQVLDLALLVTATLVASPHTQRLHFSALVVPAVVLILALASARVAQPPGPSGRRNGLARAALAAMFLTGTLIPAVLLTRNAALVYEALSPHLWTALLVGVALLVLRVRSELAAGRRHPPADAVRAAASGAAGRCPPAPAS